MRASTILLASALLVASLFSSPASAAWPPLGRVLTTAFKDQQVPQIAPDGLGGAIVVWQDFRNPRVNVFHRGFKACDSYAGGEAAMAAITCPVLFVLGAQDQMTLPKSAQLLIGIAKDRGKSLEVVSLPVGHHQMTEAPDATLFAIRDFLKK